jgi:hypothetical protein
MLIPDALLQDMILSGTSNHLIREIPGVNVKKPFPLSMVAAK